MKIFILAFTLTVFGLAGISTAEEAAPYPLTTCIVSGEALDSMGKPFVFVYEGQEVKLCCKSCKKDFDKDPAKYLEKLKTEKSDTSGVTDQGDHADHQH